MSVLGLPSLGAFRQLPEDILANRASGQIYCADFASGEGRYISSTIESSDPVDAILKISPRIEVRLTYIIQEGDVKGIQIAKLNSDKSLDKIHLSTLDWQGVLSLLYIFDNVDLKSVASGSLVLNSSIIKDPVQLEKFLNTVASDPNGRKKLEEVATNFEILSPGDIDGLALRKNRAELMDNLLNSPNFFEQFKLDQGIGQKEGVWQKFFTDNDWLLGSEIVEVLGERRIDEDSTSDLPVRSIDGFLDIIELKLPEEQMWTKEVIPTTELTKATMQCMRYITEYERRFNDHKKIEELGVDILKPRITLVFGRTTDWTPEMHQQLRVLNSSYHNITVLTYDHVLERAKRISGSTQSPKVIS